MTGHWLLQIFNVIDNKVFTKMVLLRDIRLHFHIN